MFSTFILQLLLIGATNLNPASQVPDFSSIQDKKHIQEQPLEEVNTENLFTHIDDMEQELTSLENGVYDVVFITAIDEKNNILLEDGYFNKLPQPATYNFMPDKLKSSQLQLNTDKLICFQIQSNRLFVQDGQAFSFAIPKYIIIKNNFNSSTENNKLKIITEVE